MAKDQDLLDARREYRSEKNTVLRQQAGEKYAAMLEARIEAAKAAVKPAEESKTEAGTK